MTVSIDIIPFSNSLDMFGEPDRSAAYSISGHIVISMTSGFSIFQPRHALRLLLRSLVITFEGQSELFVPDSAYSAVRLYSVSQELVSADSIELNAEDCDNLDKPCTWNVVFNLTVPGWLPPTCLFGDFDNSGETGTRYGLYAAAKFENVDDSPRSSWFSAFCNPFNFYTVRSVKAPRCPIQLNRYTSPSYFASTSTSLFPLSNFSVRAEPDDHEHSDKSPRIPAHILSALRVVCSVPDYIGTGEERFPFSLRMRTSGLSADECARLRVAQFDIELEQTERYRYIHSTQPSSSYCTQYPVPPRSEQPPHRPLLNPHPVHTLFDLGVGPSPPSQHVLARSFSLLPEDVSGRYSLSGDGYVFAQDAQPHDNVTWFSMSSSVPVSHHDIRGGNDWKNGRSLRATQQSPLFGVAHRFLVSVDCTYDLTDGEEPERASERLHFHVPLYFVRTPPATSSGSRATTPLGFNSPSSSGRSSPCDYPIPSLPYAQALPAYSQLFESNGDRKIDYSTPLPLYTPKDTNAPNEENPI
ncbi:hypothetical protein BXZ70DRAFT_885463 [Cristinia sonorae]|uniref:Uncharacterized protein n=1 Tax=Cristinia sonorae TaxID=1940300 RepID=A0A8K0XU53_9AGAR|nr:hypothetical protein BXZ70DRAFT_885463 [Cristinia sonorae]